MENELSIIVFFGETKKLRAKIFRGIDDFGIKEGCLHIFLSENGTFVFAKGSWAYYSSVWNMTMQQLEELASEELQNAKV